MRSPRNPVEEVARILLVIGAIILLVANLIPRGAGRDVLIVLGAVLIGLGIVGTIIGLLIGGKSQRSGKGAKSRSWGYR